MSKISAFELISIIDKLHAIQALLPAEAVSAKNDADQIIGYLMHAGMSDVEVDIPTTTEVPAAIQKAA